MALPGVRNYNITKCLNYNFTKCLFLDVQCEMVTRIFHLLNHSHSDHGKVVGMKKKVAAALALAVAVVFTVIPLSTANAANPALVKEIAQLKASNAKFTYWIGLIYSDAANQNAVDTINAWAKSRGIQANPVLVNQNNLTAQITAALTAKTMPDAFDASSGLMLQLGTKNLLNIQDVLNGLITKYHGLNPGAAFFNSSDYAGKGLGIPYGINGNLLNRRLDLLKSKKAPTTWEEALTMGKAAMPSGGSWGFNTGNVGDAETVFGMIFHDYGGRIADNAGKVCTIDTPATRNFMTFIKKAYDAKVYPSDSTNSDGAWDNNKYLGGKTVFIANPGSVYTTLIGGSSTWDKNPKMAKNTGFSALPGGPVTRVAPSDAWLRVVSKTTKYPELAKDLIGYLMGFSQMHAYYAKAIYGPSFKGYNHFTIWRKSVDPARSGLFELAMYGVTGQTPDINNAAIAEFTGGFGISNMVQRFLFDKVSMDTAISEAQTSCAAIYKKHA
jgi:multiple sugar transport system substrate-binding protein